MPQSKWQELAKFTPEEMTGKPLLPSAAKAYKRQVRLEPDHTPINHDITEDPIPVQGGHDDPQLPLQQEGHRLGETFRHPPSGRPPGSPLQSGRAALPFGTTTRSGRASIPPELFMEQVYAVLDDSDAVKDYELQREAEDPIAFAATGSDPDTLHYNAAKKAHDCEDFKVAMIKEANDHTTRLHWALWEKRNVPAGHKILSAIWAFKRKRRIDTRAVYKHKARINVHGGQQTYGVNYWETFSPVVNWFSIRHTLVLSLIYQWKTRQIDFVLAFPQADVECELYMELSRGLIFEGCHRGTHCLKILKNLFGQKQAGRVWHEYLVEGLHSGGRWWIWWQIHPLSLPVSVTVSAYFCCKTRIYMACRTRLLLERICHPIRFSFAICLCICQIRPKGPFILQGLSDIVSAYVSAFSSRICLRICHLPRPTGRPLILLADSLNRI
jgi:hypothetical protein